MSFESTIFLDLMPDTVTVSTLKSNDFYGRPSYSTAPISIRAHITYRPGIIRLDSDETIHYTHTVWLASTRAAQLLPSAKLTLPDGTHYEVKKLEQLHDKEGVHHFKAYLGRK